MSTEWCTLQSTNPLFPGQLTFVAGCSGLYFIIEYDDGHCLKFWFDADEWDDFAHGVSAALSERACKHAEEKWLAHIPPPEAACCRCDAPWAVIIINPDRTSTCYCAEHDPQRGK